MTKKHFIALADVMRDAQPNGSQPNMLIQWRRDCEALADFCQQQNPNFMRERWFAYLAGECGPNGGSK